MYVVLMTIACLGATEEYRVHVNARCLCGWSEPVKIILWGTGKCYYFLKPQRQKHTVFLVYSLQFAFLCVGTPSWGSVARHCKQLLSHV